MGASFEEDVAAYAAAGFDGIGIWEFKLPEDERANLALLREAGLTVANCVPTVPSILPLRLPGMEGPSDLRERVAALCASMRRLAAYEPESVLVITGPLGDLDEGSAHRTVLESLREPEEVGAGQALFARSLDEANPLIVSGHLADQLPGSVG